MCGIIGYTGSKAAKDILLKSLKRLEYRGYDSAGIAVVDDELNVFKDKGDMDHLMSITPDFKGTMGIGHTRWATHGKPLKNNSHPFKGCKGEFAIVHNGIIENFNELKDELMKKGHVFTSETDTEVIVHLLEENYDGVLEEAIRKVVKLLKGSFAIAAISRAEKDKVVGARMISPLIVGVGDNENFIASDVPAILEYTNTMIYLLDEEIVTVSHDSIDIMTFDGTPVERESQIVDMTLDGAEKGGYEHFMLKEIF
ncbi:MAG: class II glutamine amidotransferase, partial [Thermoplasmata archaeon]|nr:class II glutamine amidotransferase [Thermoplasmata archaeon]